MPLVVIPEPKNRHDRNALGLWIQTTRFFFFTARHQVGYISADLAVDLKHRLKKGAAISARILEVTGGGWFKNRGVNIEILNRGMKRGQLMGSEDRKQTDPSTQTPDAIDVADPGGKRFRLFGTPM